MRENEIHSAMQTLRLANRGRDKSRGAGSPTSRHDPFRVLITAMLGLHIRDAVIARHQQYVTIDEIFFGEDICYNHGLLISPTLMREFVLPYYQQVITNLKRRQLDPTRHLYLQIDTDGDCRPAIPVYREIGMDVMSPFEVASGCDVVAIGRQYPDLVMAGGVDKRVLAQGKREIDAMVDRIFPVMRARGGYVPTCDHGVPAEAPYENYLHYRKRALEFAR